jgi:hypothetical protein
MILFYQDRIFPEMKIRYEDAIRNILCINAGGVLK